LKSIIRWFSKKNGIAPVDAVINAHIEPQSGINPVSVGQLKSGLMANTGTFFLIKSHSFDKCLYPSVVPKPTITKQGSFSTISISALIKSASG
jgi:hypothetical protein